MTIFPYQINEAIHVYNRTSKIKPSSVIEKTYEEPQDIVSISDEAKKRQIMEQARHEVMATIRKEK